MCESTKLHARASGSSHRTQGARHLAVWVMVAEREEEDVVESLEASRRRLQAALQPAEGLLAAIAGVVLCFAGRYFPYLAFFWRAFMLKGWPPISNAVAQLRRRYETKAGASSTAPERSSGFLQVKQSMQSMLSRLQTLTQANRDVPELRQELLGLQTDLAQVAPMALAEISSVNELLAELRQVYKECLAEATLEASSYMGLNFNVGDSVATGLNRFSAPRLRVLLENALQRAGIQLQILREDPLACRLLEALIRAASNSMGIAASYFVEARLCALSNARLGAKIAVNGLTRWMIRNGHWQQDGMGSSKVLAEHTLCLAGLYWQFLRGGVATFLYSFLWGSWGVSRTAMLLLGLPLLLESWIQASIAANRAGLMDA